jgi:RNA polymerase sigma-70 factor (ECF subfamily)
MRRRPRVDAVPLSDDWEHADPRQSDAAGHAARRVDLSRAMARLKPRERELLWLAYAQGSSHQEIAATLRLKTSSIKALLFRARQRLATMLRERQS